MALRDRIERLEAAAGEWVVCRQCGVCGEMVASASPWLTPCGSHPKPPPPDPRDIDLRVRRGEFCPA